MGVFQKSNAGKYRFEKSASIYFATCLDILTEDKAAILLRNCVTG